MMNSGSNSFTSDFYLPSAPNTLKDFVVEENSFNEIAVVPQCICVSLNGSDVTRVFDSYGRNRGN